MYERLLQIINDVLEGRGDEFDLEQCDFIDDAVFDSIEFVTLIVEIEEAFSIELMNDDLKIENLRNLDLICKIVERNLGEKE